MIKIVRATHKRDYIIEIQFSDGSSGDYDLDPLLDRETELTKPLKDIGYFKRYFIELGALGWPSGLELSPAAIHRQLEASGTLRRTSLVA